MPVKTNRCVIFYFKSGFFILLMANLEIITLIYSAGNKPTTTKICRAAGQIGCQATGNSLGAPDGQSAPANKQLVNK